jgi:hypothetical protein
MRSRLGYLVVLVCFPVTARGEPIDDAFDALTSHVWGAVERGPYGFTETLKFERGGQYHWFRMSDYVERDGKGAWRIDALDKSSGVIRLYGPGDLPFQIEGDKLWLGHSQLTRGDPIKFTDEQRRNTVRDLSQPEPMEMTKRFAATAWVKTNPFDDYRCPERIEFDLNGRYMAIYRGGTCRNGGLWGLMRGSRGDGRSWYTFVGRADPNECGFGGATAVIAGHRIQFADNLLLLDQSYAPAAERPANNVFVFDRYGDSVQTRGEFAGALVKDRPLRIEFGE